LPKWVQVLFRGGAADTSLHNPPMYKWKGSAPLKLLGQKVNATTQKQISKFVSNISVVFNVDGHFNIYEKRPFTGT
jgi:hypothetical protein